MNQTLWPALGPFYAAATPWVETLLRVWCGVALLPHALRCFFGWFPNTGSRILTPTLLAQGIERSGFRPGRAWVYFIALVDFVAAPALILGLATHLAALLIFLFLLGAAYDHARFDGYFTVAGGGALSLDRLLAWP